MEAGQMRMIALSVGLASLAGCASSGAAKFGTTQIMGGQNGDLRVFVDHKCPQTALLDDVREKYVERERGVGGLAVEVLSHVGVLAFKSFGTFLQKAGEASVTQSFGVTGGYFFTEQRNPGRTVEISRDMRCIYLVRNGFALQSAQFAAAAPEDLRRKWGELGLNKTPDLFMVLHLETTADVEMMSRLPDWLDYFKTAPPLPQGQAPRKFELSSPAPYFRAKLDRLYVREFQDRGMASSYRDFAIVLNYNLAVSGTGHSADGGERTQADPTRGAVNVLSAGGIRFPGVQKGDYREDLLLGLQTAWIRMPVVKKQDEDNPRAAIDLSVYVVESSPGNPLLQKIGEYLAGDAVASSVVGAVKDELKN
jgi:hypothetical protein